MDTHSVQDARASLEEDLGRFVREHALVADPYPLFVWLRQNAPVAEVDGVRLLTRYQDVVEGYRNQLFSRRRGVELEAAAHPSGGPVDETVQKAHEASFNMMINLDEPDHKRVRQILEIAFKPTRVVMWKQRIEAITDELVDRVAGKVRFDFRREIAFPLPERVICELMGVPIEDHALWSRWSETVVDFTNKLDLTAEESAAVLDAHRGFYLYFKELIEKRRDSLSDDLVSVLIRAEGEEGRLTELEMLGSLQMLIEAGHETTANLVCNGMYTLLKHPEQYELLREDPDLAPAAVEEMLRYASPAHRSLLRVALDDVAMSNGFVPKGCPILMQLNAANRDPAIFEEPESFDIRRKANRHIAFAAGPHFCLGNQLARMEAESIFRAIATRLPRLELVEEPKFRRTNVRALESLVVRKA